MPKEVVQPHVIPQPYAMGMSEYVGEEGIPVSDLGPAFGTQFLDALHTANYLQRATLATAQLVRESYERQIDRKHWMDAASHAGLLFNNIYMMGILLNRTDFPEGDQYTRNMEERAARIGERLPNDANKEIALTVLTRVGIELLHEGTGNYRYRPATLQARAIDKMNELSERLRVNMTDKREIDSVEAVVAAIMQDRGLFRDTLKEQSARLLKRVGLLRRDPMRDRRTSPSLEISDASRSEEHEYQTRQDDEFTITASSVESPYAKPIADILASDIDDVVARTQAPEDESPLRVRRSLTDIEGNEWVINVHNDERDGEEGAREYRVTRFSPIEWHKYSERQSVQYRKGRVAVIRFLEDGNIQFSYAEYKRTINNGEFGTDLEKSTYSKGFEDAAGQVESLINELRTGTFV